MGQFSKRWEDLQIYDNYIFCTVMQDEHLCRELLEIMLDVKIERIEYLATEHHIETEYDAHGIRLDVFVKESDRVFNIEMQTGNYSDIIMRSRYYQGAMDVDTTERGVNYNKLKETYILFICCDDPFGMGIPSYTKETHFLETDEVPYADKTHVVFYNASAWDKAEDAEKQAVLRFISTLKADSEFTKELQDSIHIVKSNRDFRKKYMTVEWEIAREKREARETGLAEGRAEGLAQGRAEGEKNLLLRQIKSKLEKNKSVEQIADELEIPLSQAQELIHTLT